MSLQLPLQLEPEKPRIEIEERYCEIAAKRLAQETLFAQEPTA